MQTLAAHLDAMAKLCRLYVFEIVVIWQFLGTGEGEDFHKVMCAVYLRISHNAVCAEPTHALLNITLYLNPFSRINSRK